MPIFADGYGKAEDGTDMRAEICFEFSQKEKRNV